MNLIAKITNNIRTISTYTIVGVGTAVGYLILYVLLIEIFSFRPIFAAILGYLPAIIASYILCYKWVFRSNLSYTTTSVKFFIVNGLGYLINTLGIFIIVEFLDFSYLLGQVLTFIVVALHNYFLNFYWTFKN
jgi:putative flippase GtrA